MLKANRHRNNVRCRHNAHTGRRRPLLRPQPDLGLVCLRCALCCGACDCLASPGALAVALSRSINGAFGQPTNDRHGHGLVERHAGYAGRPGHRALQLGSGNSSDNQVDHWMDEGMGAVCSVCADWCMPPCPAESSLPSSNECSGANPLHYTISCCRPLRRATGHALRFAYHGARWTRA